MRTCEQVDSCSVMVQFSGHLLTLSWLWGRPPPRLPRAIPHGGECTRSPVGDTCATSQQYTSRTWAPRRTYLSRNKPSLVPHKRCAGLCGSRKLTIVRTVNNIAMCFLHIMNSAFAVKSSHRDSLNIVSQSAGEHSHRRKASWAERFTWKCHPV